MISYEKLRSLFHSFAWFSAIILGLLAWITKLLVRSFLCSYIKENSFKLDEIYFCYIRTALFYCVYQNATKKRYYSNCDNHSNDHR